MATPAIPEHIVRFIRQHIHSVLQLEMLLLLRERGGEWTTISLAAELRITEQSSDFRLRDLVLRGFLVQDPQAKTYRYAPQSEELDALVAELAECYATTRYTVINLIFSVPGDSDRSLADALRIPEKKD
ncbi:MAG: hypothetical protein DIU78_001465 [Pseudomonadota bacterium]